MSGDHILSKPKFLPDLDEMEKDDLKPIPIEIPYSVNIARHIIGKIFEGKKLTDLAGKGGVPSLASIFGWMKSHPDFREAYDTAREAQALLASEEIVELNRTITSIDVKETPIYKLKFDILKFIAERNDRDRYAQAPPKAEGDKGTTIVINTGIQKDTSDTRTIEDLKAEMREINTIDVNPSSKVEI